MQRRKEEREGREGVGNGGIICQILFYMVVGLGLLMESDCFHYIFVSKLTLVTSVLTNTAHWSLFCLRKLTFLKKHFFFHFLVLHPARFTSCCSSFEVTAVGSLLSPDWLLALDARQIIPLSWLQQTGNAPQQVMLQALFRCDRSLLARRNSPHCCCSVFPSAPTMPPFF